jgi:hypothetical protein
MKFEFIINLKAAKQIGLTIPVRVLEGANQVIKQRYGLNCILHQRNLA